MREVKYEVHAYSNIRSTEHWVIQKNSLISAQKEAETLTRAHPDISAQLVKIIIDTTVLAEYKNGQNVKEEKYETFYRH